MPLAGKIAVITGASRGLGYALAQGLGAQGAQIVALARTTGGLEQLDDAIKAAGGPPVALVPVDLSSGHEQLDRLGAHLHERFGRVDILIHAAAMLGTLGPLVHEDPTDMTRVMNVNAIAGYRLIRSLDPLLRAAPAARVVGIDCALGDDTIAYWAPYRASKAALRTFVQTYAAETANTKIKAEMITPAAMATKLHGTAYPGVDFATLATPETEAAAIIRRL